MRLHTCYKQTLSDISSALMVGDIFMGVALPCGDGMLGHHLGDDWLINRQKHDFDDS
ncbi:hypothetical protein [Moraxella sp.]|uniref:hypothetical protein n=1 Tax=Moraxella sp. TaxID=479 RepID=UPI0026DA8197|nr:hypothetical protein [Moraxella sp.]MDO4895170.1 hypothetical protein [Moraxella sp.]